MRRYLMNLLLVLGSLSFAFILIEVSCRIFVDAKSTAEIIPESLTTTIDAVTYEQSGCMWKDTQYPHPYLDFVQYKSDQCNPKINSNGFPSPEFPATNPPETFDVLIVGGSVAQLMAQGLHGAHSIISRLEEYKSKDGRPIKAYSTAQGSYKQPQHFFAYFLYQELFDAVISVEGFNEMSVLDNPKNRISSPFHLSATLHNYQDLNFRWMINFTAFFKRQWSNFSVIRNSYSYTLMLRTLYFYVTNHVNEKFNEGALRKMFINKKEVWDVQSYMRIIEKFNLVTLSNGQKFALFFQPVPGIGKELTPKEKTFLAPAYFYENYAMLVKDAAHLDVPLHSLLLVFKDTKEELYSDSIHMKIEQKTGYSRGYELIINEILRVLSGEWGIKPKVSKR